MEMRQSFAASSALDFRAVIAAQFEAAGLRASVTPGMRIAVGVGSRGITNLKEIVQAALSVLTAAGARPFLVPAMGSHGGATPAGQLDLLAGYGITPVSMGVPIDASMEVRRVGAALDGREVVLSAAALDADGIVVLNRVKPHTDFRGSLGSGLQKMLVIGFGKQIGAQNAHGSAAHLGYEVVLRGFAQTILDAAPIFCGIALLEDQHHQTAEIAVLPPGELVRAEDALFQKADRLLARLPFDAIDLLIVDRMGKDISGCGMDTNVVGRDVTGYTSSLQAASAVRPHIARIFVRDLTPASHGNGTGLGLADFTTARLVRSLNLQYTYMNALTALTVQTAKIPIYFENDRAAIEAALLSLAAPDQVRVVRITDTLNVERFLASEACLAAMNGQTGVTTVGAAREMAFDADLNLLPF